MFVKVVFRKNFLKANGPNVVLIQRVAVVVVSLKTLRKLRLVSVVAIFQICVRQVLVVLRGVV